MRSYTATPEKKLTPSGKCKHFCLCCCSCMNEVKLFISLKHYVIVWKSIDEKQYLSSWSC